MASLKDLRNRIASVKSTQKITSAMKMVAAAKLRRAQEQAEAARPYAERMDRMLGSLAASLQGRAGVSPMLAGTGDDRVHLLVAVTSDRGLCGGFNTGIVRRTRQLAAELKEAGKTVKIVCVGRKGRDLLRRDWGDAIVASYTDIGRRRLGFEDADAIAGKITEMFEAGEFDICTMVYNRFKSVISQVVTAQQLIPFAPPESEAEDASDGAGAAAALGCNQPDAAEIQADLLPRNHGVKLLRGLR
ncbi:MAG: ATP synthase F1 subunit gamma, partial [Rhodospirillaceae bacterium]|nr:ATP synthase F1 subunit gamma [Rhodospirillaceae bacterium]